ncbi:MAG: hypothetical protein HYS27_10400 [Deltaproteobacteria bacterium]|nr:hypothetical protein [Deltaproteobacteria bacterium]
MNALIFQCPACRALVGAARAELQPGRAGLRCAACGAVAWLPEAGAAGEAHVVDVEAEPRVAPPRELPAASGALVVAAPSAPAPATIMAGPFDAELRARLRERLAALPPSGGAQEELAAAFVELLDTWQGEAAHKALLRRASAAGELAFVGQRYRAVLDVAPNDAAARRAQEEVLALAMATMSATRDLGALGEDQTVKAKRRALWAGVIAFAFVAIVLWAMRERDALLRSDADGAKMLEHTAEEPAR